MSKILLLLGVITEAGGVCFNYKGLTKPEENEREPPSVPTSPHAAGLPGTRCPA